jgi:hypothetical protein
MQIKLLKKSFVIGLIILFVCTSVLSNVTGVKIENNDESNDLVKFIVYDCEDSNYKKIVKEIPVNKALELKDGICTILQGQESVYEKIVKQISLLEDYDLIPKNVSKEKILENTKVKNTKIIESLGRLRINFLIDKDIEKQGYINFFGGIGFIGMPGVILALGTHTIFPTIGVDIALKSWGDFFTVTTGLFGTFEGDGYNWGRIIGFGGFLILGLLGIYLPVVMGVGVYGFTSWTLQEVE